MHHPKEVGPPARAGRYEIPLRAFAGRRGHASHRRPPPGWRPSHSHPRARPGMAAPACADRKFGMPNIDEPVASTISSPSQEPDFPAPRVPLLRQGMPVRLAAKPARVRDHCPLLPGHERNGPQSIAVSPSAGISLATMYANASSARHAAVKIAVRWADRVETARLVAGILCSLGHACSLSSVRRKRQHQCPQRRRGVLWSERDCGCRNCAQLPWYRPRGSEELTTVMPLRVT